MPSLLQQLRELSKEAFEEFVHQYLNSRYPRADIKRVEGSGGDEGIDSFSGMLSSGPAIWQSKHFPDRIRQTQQRQILRSIRSSSEHSPSLWTLCVPINLRTAEHRWFEENVVSVYGGPNLIKLLQASDFLQELNENRPLRDAFFPANALSNMMDVRRAVTLADGRTEEQNHSAMIEYAQQYLEGSMALEPRLRGVVSVGGTQQMRQPSQQHGLVMSVSQGERTTNFFARDIQALNLDPIRFSMSMPVERLSQLNEAIDLGKRFTLPAGEIIKIQSSSPLLESLLNPSQIDQMQMEMIPTLPPEIRSRTFPVRLVAGPNCSQVTIPYVPFNIVRSGRREMELSSSGEVPLNIRLTLNLDIDKGAHFSIRPEFLNADACRAKEAIDFLEELERSSLFRLEMIDTNTTMLEAPPQGIKAALNLPQGFKAVVSDIAFISKTFHVPLQLPADISEDDMETIVQLRRIGSGEDFFGANLSLSFTKQGEFEGTALDTFGRSPFMIKLENQKGEKEFKLFGKTIRAGGLTLTVDKSTMVDYEETRNAYEQAAEGQAIDILVHCEGPCRFIREAV